MKTTREKLKIHATPLSSILEAGATMRFSMTFVAATALHYFSYAYLVPIELRVCIMGKMVQRIATGRIATGIEVL